MSKKIAINGFGRIGRGVFKNIISKYSKEIEIVAINDLSKPETILHLLEYDSVYGRYKGNFSYDNAGFLNIEIEESSFRIKLLAEKDPQKLPWKDMDVDIVLECTGIFTKFENANYHIGSGAKKVIISAPSKEPEKIPSFILGVNEEKYNPREDNIVDMGSCTTNCLAPIVKIINDSYKIKKGMMTTVHSYTISQNLLDGAHKDLRRARAGALNIIPTTTGAAKAVGRVLPEVEGKISGIAMRVPTPTVSIVDFVCSVEKRTSKEELLSVLEEKSMENNLKEILHIEKNPLVSSDFKGSSYSSIIDSEMTDVDGELIKIISWYDNEWGYSSRLADFTSYILKNDFI